MTFKIDDIRKRAFTINSHNKMKKFKGTSVFAKTIKFFEDTYLIYVENNINEVERVFSEPTDDETCVLLFFLFIKKKLQISDPLEFIGSDNQGSSNSPRVNGKEAIIYTTDEQRQWGAEIQENFYWFMNNILDNATLDLFLEASIRRFNIEAREYDFDGLIKNGYIGETANVDGFFYNQIRRIVQRNFNETGNNVDILAVNNIEVIFRRVLSAITTPHANMEYVRQLVHENLNNLSRIRERIDYDRNLAIIEATNIIEHTRDSFYDTVLTNSSGVIELYYVKQQYDIINQMQNDLDKLKSEFAKKIRDPDWLNSVIN
ncbi:hypothetical protein [Enterococcus sp. AD013-P3]|uniref:hypothetical protein n=1 Tax=Enterococcus sp. AD013-P3 TaxID=3411036 RepID=UPI003B965988